MKFRTDFVTNSSSSSFCAVSFDNKELAEYLASLGIKCDSAEFCEYGSFELPSGAVLDYELCDDTEIGVVWKYAEQRRFVSGSITGWFMSGVIESLRESYRGRPELDEFLRLIGSTEFARFDQYLRDNIHISSGYHGEGDSMEGYIVSTRDGKMRKLEFEGWPGEAGEAEIVEAVGDFEDGEIEEQIEDCLENY